MSQDAKSFYWIVWGVRCYGLMKQGKYASVARIVKQGIELGVYEESASWRTAILLNYRIGEDI